MSLPDVLLSLLREPMSGSDLIRLFQGSIDHFWNTDLSQIYRTLETLEGQECLASRSEPSPRGPARRVYRLTGKGRARLDEWIASPLEIPRAKFEYLAKLFSAPAADNPKQQARRLLLDFRRQGEESLATLEAIDAHMQEMFGGPADMPDAFFFPWLTLRHGLRRRKALVDWVDESLALLDRRADTAGDPESMRKLMLALGLVEPVADETPESQE